MPLSLESSSQRRALLVYLTSFTSKVKTLIFLVKVPHIKIHENLSTGVGFYAEGQKY